MMQMSLFNVDTEYHKLKIKVKKKCSNCMHPLQFFIKAMAAHSATYLWKDLLWPEFVAKK